MSDAIHDKVYLSATLFGVETTSVRKMNFKADSTVAQASFKIITLEKIKTLSWLLL
jgi:hypothetical protein